MCLRNIHDAVYIQEALTNYSAGFSRAHVTGYFKGGVELMHLFWVFGIKYSLNLGIKICIIMTTQHNIRMYFLLIRFFYLNKVREYKKKP
ncbi:hypothetical protein, partial [Klebsiella pneumoniae]|uniref:hypothetical protein n=1 Tax=Klebsiella pneumoniae TaxID=573 RepID=UPI001C6F9ED5